MPLLNAAGHPLPPSAAEQEAEQQRVTALFESIVACFAKPCATTDFLLVGINLMVRFVFTGPPEGSAARFNMMMGNLEAAMNAAAANHRVQESVNAKLRADGVLQ